MGCVISESPGSAQVRSRRVARTDRIDPGSFMANGNGIAGANAID
jgi:hypothetical protein